jgi:hypothetical protein
VAGVKGGGQKRLLEVDDPREMARRFWCYWSRESGVKVLEFVCSCAFGKIFAGRLVGGT